ncbi:MAG: serine/threonine-protein kinase [Myxococcota bacterium]
MSGTLAGRYLLLDHLGTGTAGTVYRAAEIGTGRLVAVKILGDASPQRAARLEREGRVLRELGILGVVRLLDEGEYEGRRFLVTELVDGLPFPSVDAPTTWEGLAPVVTRLFTILARVHAAGVLHRDLKPPNVLVDAAGVPTVLDFGLARFVSGDSGLTLTGDVLGTPRYQAPEQVLCNGPVDARADLYAVGVMIYEALSGRSPQPARSLGGLYSARLVRDPPPLRTVAPHVPAAVARIVDRLVARDPEDRPGSADAVLDDLAGVAPIRRAGHLPWLGEREAVARVVAAARAGRPIGVTGLRGAGRTRLLADVEEELGAAGVRTLRIPPGERPYESLAVGLDGGDGGAPTDPGDMDTRLEALRARLAAGDVLLVDDADRIDAWTATLLDSLDGAVIRVLDRSGSRTDGTGEDVHLGPLPAAALARLFARDDALDEHARFGGALLAARSAGLAARVAAEVGAWIAAGYARWSGDSLDVSDESLELLALGPPPDARTGRRASPDALSEAMVAALTWVTLAEPHATPALLATARGARRWEVEVELTALIEQGMVTRGDDGTFAARADLAGFVTGSDEERARAMAAVGHAFAPGVDGRLGALLAGEAWTAAAVEAERIGTRALDEGAFAVALAAARWGLRAAAASDTPVLTHELQALLVQAAVAVGTPAALACASTELRRAVGVDRAPGAAVLSAEASATRLDALRRQLLAGEDPATEVRDGLGATDPRDPRGAETPGERVARLVADGRRSAARGRIEHAAGLFGRAREECERPHEAWPLRLELAELLVEAGACTDAIAELAPIEAAAERHRLPLLAAYTRWIHRAAAYRTGGAIAEPGAEGAPTAATSGAADPAAAAPASPDLRAVAEAHALGVARLTARVCLTEAATAWRAGSYDEAARLARLAIAAAPGPTAVAVLARALEVAATDRGDPVEGRRLVADADALPDPAVGVQVRGLMALALPELGASFVADAEALGARAGRRGEIRAVLSCAEAIAFCRAAARRWTRPGH